MKAGLERELVGGGWNQAVGRQFSGLNEALPEVSEDQVMKSPAELWRGLGGSQGR